MHFRCGNNPPKLVLALGDQGIQLIHGFLGPPESTAKRHLDRFIRFRTAHGGDQQTQTDHATSVARARIFTLCGCDAA